MHKQRQKKRVAVGGVRASVPQTQDEELWIVQNILPKIDKYFFKNQINRLSSRYL